MDQNQATPATPTQGTGSIDEAALRLSQLGTETGKPKKAVQEVAETQTEADAPEGDDAEVLASQSDDVSEEAEEAEAEADGEATDATDEAEGENDEDEPQVFTVKVDGKEMEVSLDELKNGYSRTADYHRKTEMLANERKQFHAEIEQVRKERETYAQLLPVLAQQIEANLPQPPDPALKLHDPIEYMLRMENYREQTALWQSAQAEQARLQEVNAAEVAKQRKMIVEEAVKLLPKTLPRWSDAKLFEQDRKAMRDYAKSLPVPYSDGELDQADDPRALSLLYKAMRYDAMMAKKLKAQPKIERAMRPAGNAEQAPPKGFQQYRSTRERLRNSGSIDDAAAALSLL